MIELVSGWADNDRVYLVERAGEDTRIRAVPAKWAAFAVDMPDEDRRFIQRMREVKLLKQDGRVTRIEFTNRFARKDLAWRVRQAGESNKRVTGQAGLELLEADVNPLRRMLSDHPSLVVSARPRLGYFDLETDSRKTFTEAREGKARILSWALVDHRGREIVDCLEEDADEAERHLIERFLVSVRDDDVLLAWNGSGFDFPVLLARAGKLGVMPNGLHPLWDRWCWLDMLEVYKKYNQQHESGDEKSSFKLDDVAHQRLGIGKDPFDARRTWEAWRAGGAERARLLRYNLKDAKLLPQIEAASGYVALHLAVCHITRCFPDTLSLMASQQGDGFLMSLGAQHGHHWPTKVDRDFEAKYEGAYVMDPTRLGIVDDVHVADFASLYPTIMRTWNMSPDTLVSLFDKNETRPTCRLPTQRASKFYTDQRGMLPLALDQLVVKRGEYTKRADAAEPMSDEFDHFKRLSQAFKVVANSFYGIVGSSFTRFFSREVAEGVTQTGAWLIRECVVPKSRAAGLDPFYGDTDSVFVSGARDVFAGVVKELNAGWAPIVRQHGCTTTDLIKLEFEKSFRRLVITSAKRYAGALSVYKGKPVGDDRKPEVKGLEYKRGDSVKLARDMQRELIGMLLEPDVPEIEEFVEFVDRWRARAIDGPLSIDDVVTSQSIKSLSEYKTRFTAKVCGGTGPKGKKAKRCGYDFGSTAMDESPETCPRCGFARNVAQPPVHVRVAKLLQERGEDVREGTRIEYLVVDGSGDRIKALPAHDPGVLDSIDRNYYWESRIYPASARVLEIVFPTVAWVETAKEKKAREKEAKIAANRGVVSDLPLFAATSRKRASGQ